MLTKRCCSVRPWDAVADQEARSKTLGWNHYLPCGNDRCWASLSRKYCQLYIFFVQHQTFILLACMFLFFFNSFSHFQSFPVIIIGCFLLNQADRAVQCHSLRNVSADPDLQQDPALPFCCCLPKLSLQQLFANLSKEPDKFPTDKISTRGEVFHLYMPSSKICWEKIWK